MARWLLSIACLSTPLLVGAGCVGQSDESDTTGSALAEGGFQLDVGVETSRQLPVLTMGRASARNMHALAVVSAAAYEDEATTHQALCEAGIHARGAAPCRGNAGDVDAELVRFDTTADDHAIYVRTTADTASGPREVAVLAFRGTASRANVLTDARMDRIASWASDTADPALQGKTLPGTVHRGFAGAAARLWRGDSPEQSLRTFLLQRHARPDAPPLYVTGHSLGGAVATITLGYMMFGECATIATGEYFGVPRPTPSDQLAWTLPGTSCPAQSGIRVEALYTYGSPRVGNKTFAEAIGNMLALRRTAHFRVVNANDIVTRIAPRFTGYTHVHLNIEGLVDDDREFAIREDENADVIYGRRPSGERVAGKCRQWKDANDNPETCPTLSLAYLLDGAPAADRERTEILRLGGGATEALDDDRTFFGSARDHLVSNYIPPLKRILPPSR